MDKQRFLKLQLQRGFLCTYSTALFLTRSLYMATFQHILTNICIWQPLVHSQMRQENLSYKVSIDQISFVATKSGFAAKEEPCLPVQLLELATISISSLSICYFTDKSSLFIHVQ